MNRFRLTSLPDFPEFNRKTVPGSEDVGRILAIRYDKRIMITLSTALT